MSRSTLTLVAATLIAAALTSATASAQLNGHNFRGDYGLTSGSQPPPGWWLSLFYALYDTDTVRDKSGDRISFDPQRRSSITAQGIIPFAWWVSEKEVLGGTYSFRVRSLPGRGGCDLGLEIPGYALPPFGLGSQATLCVSPLPPRRAGTLESRRDARG